MRAVIVLEDGAIFEGESFGTPGERTGEVVFNTSVVGYQEILTDPSYKGQIVTMTYPMIGNYGINDQDSESGGVHLEGFIVREQSRIFSNFRAKGSLEDFMKENRAVGIKGVDTRALAIHIRDSGEMKGVISTKDMDPKSLFQKAKASPGLEGRDLVKEVTCDQTHVWSGCRIQDPEFKVVVIDCGIKYSLLRQLEACGCEITVVPAVTSPEKILRMGADGVLISDGPGDPASVPYVVEGVEGFLGKRPVFGVSLGHLALGLALGGRTYKMKVGHHGSNQPVNDLVSGRVSVTAQNHSFCLDEGSLPSDVEVTHINLNDRTIEGIRSRKYPAFSVQYSPAVPENGEIPDSFKKFVEMMGENR
jgi:carbamoyl-phosphate synthase small subunit